MDRRSLILSGLATAGLSACATTGNGSDPGVTQDRSIETYTVGEIKQQTSDFLGVAAETVGQAAQEETRRHRRAGPDREQLRNELAQHLDAMLIGQSQQLAGIGLNGRLAKIAKAKSFPQNLASAAVAGEPENIELLH